MQVDWRGILEKIDDYRWRIPKERIAGMRVDGVIYASERLLKDILKDRAMEQVSNVAHLPGIVKYSLGMPDIHWGYGFCIGGVAAFDVAKGGIISPGGVGYDINCGVRLMRSNLSIEDVDDKLEAIANALFHMVPTGVGSEGDIRLSSSDEIKVTTQGARWAVEKGYGTDADLDATEARGALEGADPTHVSKRAFERGRPQQGTLGSGNHFLEVQAVEEIYDEAVAGAFGLFKGQVTIMIHSGSRGFGHQICDDYIRVMLRAAEKYGIELVDRQLACAPLDSEEAKNYFAAMKCAANYAWANRQMLMFLTRKVFEKIFGSSWGDLGLGLVYDVAHNIAKLEHYTVDGKEKRLCVHRKGATRAFPPGHAELAPRFRATGQPVIIPGDMGRQSFLLTGTKKAYDETFASTCHGAGRVMSRSQAVRSRSASQVIQELREKGISIRAAGRDTIAEEAPQAYKDVSMVVDVVHGAGISKKVCRMRPLAVIKG